MPLLEPEPTENGPASQHCKMLLGFDVTSWLTSKEMLPPLSVTHLAELWSQFGSAIFIVGGALGMCILWGQNIFVTCIANGVKNNLRSKNSVPRYLKFEKVIH